MRQTGGSVVCGCGRLVDIDEEKCPHCGRWRPGMFGYANVIRRTFGDLDVTQSITGFCILLYAISLVLDPVSALQNFLSPSLHSLYQLGMTGGMPGRWYTTLSATFLHGSLLHIVFNMLWIRSLGPMVEETLGPARYFLLFLASGVGGFLLSNVMTGDPTVGASGAIFGLLAASIVIGRAHGGTFGEAVSQRALTWAVLLFVMGFFFPRTNNYAHFGGFVTGFAITRLLIGTVHRSEGPYVQLLAALGALGTVGAVVVSFIRASFHFLR